MSNPPFPFDPRRLYAGMNHKGLYYEVQFRYLSTQGFSATVVKPDHLVGASISGYHIPYFAFPWLRGYVYRRQQPTFWLLDAVRDAIVEGRFEFDVDERKLKPWYV